MIDFTDLVASPGQAWSEDACFQVCQQSSHLPCSRATEMKDVLLTLAI